MGTTALENANIKTGGLSLKQPLFSWAEKGKYVELFNFEMEMKNIFLTKNYDLADKEKVPILINCFGREGLHFIKMLLDEEQVLCKCSDHILEILNEKVKPQHNITTFSLQYLKIAQKR